MKNKAPSPLIVLAAGGTGGHVFPAEALAVELIERGFCLVLVTDRRGSNLQGRLAELDSYHVRSGGIAGKTLLLRIISIIEICIGIFQAWLLLRRLKPAVVVGFGGYASVPTMLAAVHSGVRSIIHEQNAVLGRANRLLARRVKKITTSFDKVQAIPEQSKSNIIVTGMPVRPSIRSMRHRSYSSLGSEGGINLTIFGGSQGAQIFSVIIPDALKRISETLRRRIKVTQQCRIEDVEVTKAAYHELGIEADISSFFNDIPDRIAMAHLIICRSGASTIAELTTIGRPAILVPYSFAVDDHQSHNAYAVDEIGGGWLIPEDSFTAKVLAERLESLFSIPKTLENAGAASWEAGKPNAANRLADAVLDLVPNDLVKDHGGA